MKMNLAPSILAHCLYKSPKEIFSFDPHRPDLQYSYYTYTGYTADLVVLLPPQKIEGLRDIKVFYSYLFIFWFIGLPKIHT
jgi:hypothetical protein